jgi:putative transposase
LLVDTLGLVWGVLVVSGRCAEAEGAKRLFVRVREGLTRLAVVWMDGGFEHRIEDWVAAHCSFRVEIVKRSEGTTGWELLPKRWVVERTYAWLGRWRGLAREYDYLPETTEAKILLAMTRLMLRRLTA